MGIRITRRIVPGQGVKVFAVVITEKGGAQRKMLFDQEEVTIGRVQGNDIILPKGNVSKRHAKITLKDERFIVVDQKSTNGTYVNGRKITSPLVVKPGDKVYIGDFILGVEDEEAGVTASVPRSVRQSVPPPVPGGPPAPPQAAAPPAADHRPTPVPPANEPTPIGPSPRPPAPAAAPAMPAIPAAPAVPVMPATSPAPTHAEAPATHPPPAPAGAGTGALAATMKRLALSFEVDRVDIDAMRDPDRLSHARREVEKVISDLLVEGVAGADDPGLADAAHREAVGLGALESLLGNTAVHEIVVSDPETVMADNGSGLVRVAGSFSSPSAVGVVAQRLLGLGGKTASSRRPIQEAALPDGRHITIVWPPVAVKGPIIEIRNVGPSSTLADLVNQGVVAGPTAAMLEQAVVERKNIFVVGPVGAGVTRLLGALAKVTDSSERLVTVEGLGDLDLDRPGVIKLSAGDPTTGVGISELVRQAARLHVDRLIVDDIVGAEAFDVMTAVASRAGGSLVGVHGNSTGGAVAVLSRLAGLGRELSHEGVAELVASAASIVIRVDAGPAGRRVVAVTEVSGAMAGALNTRELL